MRHYEIVLLIHPDQSNQVSTMTKRYEALVTKGGGQVHRLEDWGRRSLTYPIKNIHKAHYVLLNIETDEPTLKELTSSFRFNDAVIRSLVLKCSSAITEPSPMLKAKGTASEEFSAPSFIEESRETVVFEEPAEIITQIEEE